MPINPIGGISHPVQSVKEPAVTPAPAVTPFSQQLDAQGAQTQAAQGHHHHRHGEASQSAASATAGPVSTTGAASPGAIASSILSLLS